MLHDFLHTCRTRPVRVSAATARAMMNSKTYGRFLEIGFLEIRRPATPSMYLYGCDCQELFMAETFLTATELAQRFKIHKLTVWAWARSGRLPAPIKLGPGTTGWRLTDIQAYEQRCAEQS